MFRAVCYGLNDCQIITGGTDRKIGYWETYDGSQIRELDGSKSASINGMDVHKGHFITGGGDKLIKVCIRVHVTLADSLFCLRFNWLCKNAGCDKSMGS